MCSWQGSDPATYFLSVSQSEQGTGWPRLRPNALVLVVRGSKGAKRAPLELALCSFDSVAPQDPYLLLVIAHFKERGEGKEEVVWCYQLKDPNLAENKVLFWNVHVCPLLRGAQYSNSHANWMFKEKGPEQFQCCQSVAMMIRAVNTSRM